MSNPFADLQQGHYAAIVADPPWHFRARTALQVGNWTSRRHEIQTFTEAGKPVFYLGSELFDLVEVAA